MAVASLVLGIVSIVFSLIPGTSFVGTICGIVGIILGMQGKKMPGKEGMGKAGFVCSIIGLCLSLAFLVACAGCAGCVGMAGSL